MHPTFHLMPLQKNSERSSTNGFFLKYISKNTFTQLSESFWIFLLESQLSSSLFIEYLSIIISTTFLYKSSVTYLIFYLLPLIKTQNKIIFSFFFFLLYIIFLFFLIYYKFFLLSIFLRWNIRRLLARSLGLFPLILENKYHFALLYKSWLLFIKSFSLPDYSIVHSDGIDSYEGYNVITFLNTVQILFSIIN